MTELLEQAIATVRRLPATEQDAAAEFPFDFVARHSPPETLDPETRAAILEGCAQADRGELVSDAEVAAFFARRGA